MSSELETDCPTYVSQKLNGSEHRFHFPCIAVNFQARSKNPDYPLYIASDTDARGSVVCDCSKTNSAGSMLWVIPFRSAVFDTILMDEDIIPFMSSLQSLEVVEYFELTSFQ
jgi:hypothetical protein